MNESEKPPIPELPKQEKKAKPEPEQPESREKTLENAVTGLLTEKGLIDDNEVAQLDQVRLEEMMVRTAHDFENLPEIIPQANVEKVRRILGFNPRIGDGKVDIAPREREIKETSEEMSAYLEKFSAAHPEITGMILCGSRMDSGKMPAPNSDVDVVLILKPGVTTNSRTEEGRAMVEKLRSFTDSNHTDSGLEVKLDEFYSTDELLVALDSPTDTSKLTWGWNPNAVKYIGNDIGDKDDLQVQVRVLQGLNSNETKALKQKHVTKAKAEIAKHLDLEKR